MVNIHCMPVLAVPKCFFHVRSQGIFAHYLLGGMDCAFLIVFEKSDFLFLMRGGSSDWPSLLGKSSEHASQSLASSAASVRELQPLLAESRDPCNSPATAFRHRPRAPCIAPYVFLMRSRIILESLDHTPSIFFMFGDDARNYI